MAEILVVGAGPVGLTLAAELARHGVRPRIIDAAPAPSPYCRAIGVTPRTLEVYDDMGIAQAMIDAGLWLEGLRVQVKGRVNRTRRVDLSDLPYAALGVPQGETERILAAHLATFGIAVERGVRFSALTQGERIVRAELTTPDGSREVGHFSYVIGCDGAHSAVRHALGLAFEGEAFPWPFMLGDVQAEWPAGAELPRGFALRAMDLRDDGPPDLFIAIPLPERGRYRVSMLAEADAAEAVPADGISHGIQADRPGVGLAALQAVANRVMEKPPVLSDLRWSSHFRISMRLAARYRVGRVFIAGDAAHIHPPTGGQGMNTGIQDAYNLAWKLALVEKGQAGEALLESYEAERRPVAQDVIARTTQESLNLGRRRKPPGRLADTQILLSYRAKPGDAAPGDQRRSGPLQAGDRAPDVQGLRRRGVGFPLRLFDLLRGPAHVLLVSVAVDEVMLRTLELEVAPFTTGGLPLRVVAVTAQRALEHVPVIGRLAAPHESDPVGMTLVHDADGAFAATYHAPPGTAILVRPDGYIGWIGQPFTAADLRAYLTRVLGQGEGPN